MITHAKARRLGLVGITVGALLATAAPANAASDLNVTLADAPDPVSAGANLTYTITVRNAGTTAATNVTLQDATPAGTTFVSFTSPAGWTSTTPAAGGTGTISTTNASVAGGSTHSFTLVVNVNQTATGTLTDTATVTSNPVDPTPADNSATVTTTVQRVSDLKLTATAGPTPAPPGSTLTYNLGAQNQGPSNAQSTVLSFPLPPDTTFISATQTAGPAFTTSTPAVGGTGTVTFTTPSFVSGATALFVVRTALSATPTRERVVSNTSLTSSSVDPSPGDAAQAISLEVDRADLGVAVDAAPVAVSAGGDVAFPITLTNDGTRAATDVTLTDALPAGTTFVSLVSGPGASCATPAAGAGGTVTCSLASLAPGEVAQATLVLRVDPAAANGTAITNSAEVGTSTLDLNDANDADRVTIAVVASPVQPPAAAADTKLQGATIGANAKGVLKFTVENPNDFAIGGELSAQSAKSLRSRRASKIVNFGSTSYQLAANQTGRVKLKLSRKSLRVLKREKSIKAKVTITTSAAGRPDSADTWSVTLLAPRA